MEEGGSRLSGTSGEQANWQVAAGEGHKRSTWFPWVAKYKKNSMWDSDGKFRSFYWLGPLSLVQQNEQIFFRVILFILAKYNKNVTCYFPNTSTTYANVDHTTNNTQL